MVFDPSASLYYGWELNREKLLEYIYDHFDIESDDDLEGDFTDISEEYELKFKKLEFKSIYFGDYYKNYVIIKQCYVSCNENWNLEEFDPVQEYKNIPKYDLQKVKKIGGEGKPKVFLISSTGVF